MHRVTSEWITLIIILYLVKVQVAKLQAEIKLVHGSKQKQQQAQPGQSSH